MNFTYSLYTYIIQFILLFFGLGTSYCFAQQQDDYKINIVQNSNKNSNQFKSLFEVNNILQSDPNNVQALFIRGKIKSELGAYKGAQTDFSQAIFLNANANNIEIYYHRGISYYMENDFLNAIADFDSVLNLQNDHIGALWKKAQSFYFIGENLQTINALDEITIIQPDDPIVWHDLGTLYYKNKELHKAKDCFTKSLILNPRLSISYNHRGIIHENLKQYSLAFDDFTRAIQYDSSTIDAYNNRGLIYMLFEDYHEAEIDFTLAIEHSKDSAKEALNNRALARCVMGNYENSLEDINLLIASYPFYSKAYLTRGNIKEYMHDDSGACSDWQKAAELGDLIGMKYTQTACH